MANEATTFQERVAPWMAATFGAEISGDREERNHRFLEEALELVQSNGCSVSEAHQLVDYVFGRPVGEPPQEVGGVMVTLAALCLASGLDMHEAAETELTRVWTKVEQIRAKQAAKPKHSPLPAQSAPPEDASGYQLAFYELAGLMKIGARAQAPAHVWRSEMLPRLLVAFGAKPAETSEEDVERARTVLVEHARRHGYPLTAASIEKGDDPWFYRVVIEAMVEFAGLAPDATQTREAALAHAVANILPVGDDRAPGDRVIPIYVRMDELRALRELAALSAGVAK